MAAPRIINPYAQKAIAHPIMRQTWRNLTFLHWRYDPQLIRRTLPPQLTLDTFDGNAWIGLAPFVLAGVRPFGMPSMRWISQFPETNVRTYVLGPDGKPGVWFYTLEADRLLAVLAARAWYKLPYRWAKMSVSVNSRSVEYGSRRNASFGKGATDIEIAPAGMMSAQDLDNFLTARFRLYAVHRGRVGYAEIDHDPWPLQYGRLRRLDEDLIFHSGLPAPSGEPIVHYSSELQVRVAPLRWL